MKIKITELKGIAHIYTLSDGKTFRLFPKQTVTLPEELVTEHIHSAQAAGDLILTPVGEIKKQGEEDKKSAPEKETKETNKKNSKEEKNSGGQK